MGADLDAGPAASSKLGPRLISFPTYVDARGRLTAIEAETDLPFAFRRLYYVHGVDAGQSRGDHAHRYSQTVLIALHGRFKAHVDDGVNQSTFCLDDPERGLVIPPMVWLRVDDFGPGAVCGVLSSHPYDEDDYYRDYAAFRGTMAGPA